MSNRSDYSDDIGNQELIMWRGAVKQALRENRGQAFLRELLAALDAMPDKRLVAGQLQEDGEVCALGAVGRCRGIDLEKLDPEDYEAVATTLNIAPAMAREIAWINDDAYPSSPERRYAEVRKWVVESLEGDKP